MSLRWLAFWDTHPYLYLVVGFAAFTGWFWVEIGKAIDDPFNTKRGERRRTKRINKGDHAPTNSKPRT